MYKSKFNYVPLKRVNIDGQRRYNTPDGKKLPSVTTILDRTKSEESRRALQEWRNRVGHERAQQITTEAAGRGTTMHKYLEDYVRTGTLPNMPNNIFNHDSWNMADNIVKQGLVNCTEFWGIEVPLYFPDIYAGTTDCIGIHDNRESIIDFKQSNKPKKREWIDDYFLQLVAYADGHNELHNTNIKRGVIMMCVKPTENNKCQYQEFVIDGSEFEKYRDQWWDRVKQYYDLNS